MLQRIFRGGYPVFLALLLPACGAINRDAGYDDIQNRHDRPAAEVAAKAAFVTETACNRAATDKVLAVRDVEGAPMGPVWSDYSISVTGCGQTKTYAITCKGTFSKPDCLKGD